MVLASSSYGVNYKMDLKTHENYVTTVELEIDLKKVKESCYKLQEQIKNFEITEDGYQDASGKAPITTRVHDQYNLFMYGLEGFHPLFFEIQKLFRSLNHNPGEYYILSWLNLYKFGEYVDWHEHYPSTHNTWHGFYCVDCEPSKTTYILPNKSAHLDIVSRNNLLVMSPGSGDWHRTWPWEFKDRDRITIAFDIVPRDRLYVRSKFWIPI